MILQVFGLLTTLLFIEGCLITNCPKGGKRSSVPYPLQQRSFLPLKKEQECRRCGSNLEGVCVSDTICCSPQFGCLISSPFLVNQCSNPPQTEIILRNARPCSIGLCLSEAVCCSTDTCKIEEICRLDLPAYNCYISEQ